MKQIYALVAVMVLVLGVGVHGDENSDEAAKYLQKAYPAAEAGQTRFAIILPKQDNEENYKVELIVGKKAMADSINHFFFGGKIREVNIDGWGFTRYVVKDLGPMGGTLMGGGQPMEKWVQMQSITIRYNSRLPIAVYVPQGAEVKYRIWSTTPDAKEMPKG